MAQEDKGKRSLPEKIFIGVILVGFFLPFFGVAQVGMLIPVAIMLGWIVGSAVMVLQMDGVVKKLLALPFAAAVAYGAVAFVLPGELASHVVPAGWRWPVRSTEQALSLPNGEWAVALRRASRVQIYDNDGRYRRGWYVPAGGGAFSLGLPPKDQWRFGQPAELVVRVIRGGGAEILYDLNGVVLAERKWPPGRLPILPGRFEERRFPVRWYEMPLAGSWQAGLVSVAGMVALALIRVVL